jgi:hypothetical protein
LTPESRAMAHHSDELPNIDSLIGQKTSQTAPRWSFAPTLACRKVSLAKTVALRQQSPEYH